MAFNFDMIQKHYAQLPERVNEARTLLGKPLSLTEKILYSHLWNDMCEHKRGDALKNMKCEICECRIRYKVRLSSSYCPAGKWTAIDS